ncbi:MAG: ABC transporter ATP-binding protein [Caldilineaceae bacterium]|nr:ABC transporter ATP-binding protein [Caldilineaceae bacterium]MDE0429984.1 ABC transporter ATP-binding protein [Caldilineaceae bacterium]
MSFARTLFRFTLPYRRPLLITVISMVLLVGVQLFAPWFIRALIAAVRSGETEALSSGLITRLALFALAIYAARAGLEFLRSYMAHVAGWGVVADVRVAIYRHLQRLSLHYYEDKQTGQLMSRMVNDSDLLEKLIAHAVPDVLVNVLTLVGVSAMLLTMNAQLTLLTLVPIPLIVLAMRGFAKYVRPAFRERQAELGELNAILQDNLSGIREIKTFTRERTESERIGVRIENYKRSLLHALRLLATFEPFVHFASALGIVVVIYFGGRLALGGALPIEDLVAFFLYLELFYQPVRHLSHAWEAIQEALAGAERVSELLLEEPEIVDVPGAHDYRSRARGAIQFENVSFSYLTDRPILRNIDLDVPAGSVVALVGPTGVGKSTLASLVPRFYDVNDGRILMDGHDIRELTLESLRRQISIVLQDVFLFHGTVRQNILFGRPGASEPEMREAARVANAVEFIDKLPEGYDTVIGERGVKLSGGQKQRLAIARAILKDAPVLILDEATSSVDTETELLIQQALERLMTGRTTLMIAHRLSTIRNADQIVVLQDERIAELGSHDELIALDGIYRHLNLVQSRLDDEEPAAEQRLDWGSAARPLAVSV